MHLSHPILKLGYAIILFFTIGLAIMGLFYLPGRPFGGPIFTGGVVVIVLCYRSDMSFERNLTQAGA
jgi:hypothetical protein